MRSVLVPVKTSGLTGWGQRVTLRVVLNDFRTCLFGKKRQRAPGIADGVEVHRLLLWSPD